MKIKFNLDGKLPVNKAIEIPSMIIAVRAIFMKITNIIHKFSKMNVYMNYRRKRNKKFLYFTCLFINYHCIIDSCQHLLLSDKI